MIMTDISCNTANYIDILPLDVTDIFSACYADYTGVSCTSYHNVIIFREAEYRGLLLLSCKWHKCSNVILGEQWLIYAPYWYSPTRSDLYDHKRYYFMKWNKAHKWQKNRHYITRWCKSSGNENSWMIGTIIRPSVTWWHFVELVETLSIWCRSPNPILM